MRPQEIAAATLRKESSIGLGIRDPIRVTCQIGMLDPSDCYYYNDHKSTQVPAIEEEFDRHRVPRI
jgi:hypothetical protein